MPKKKVFVQGNGRVDENVFDPEGSGYDHATAKKAGITRGKDGHFPSREPKSGRILKGRKHKTFHKTVVGEAKAGFEIFKGKDGNYYSRKKK